ncbi:SDR family oxidoreductase [Pseudomonas sp. MYb118]|uniref:SDR family oxidoreductase n=1 Tax=Pseudomonas sp. MYb118 TaxID=1848720 RepID=UPI0034CF1415
MMNTEVSGKVCIITGASSGLGQALARLLAAQGAMLAIGARREDRITALADELRETGAQVVAMVTDVTKRSDVEALVEAAKSAFGRVDVLINNAGVMPLSLLADGKIEEWEQTVDVNLKGVLYGIGAVLPIMQAQRAGHVVNIASTAGHRVIPTSAVYSATKHAVRALSEGFRQEVAEFNIRSTIISPGAMSSELLDGISDEALASQLRENIVSYMSPDDVAEAVIFAISRPANIGINEILVRPTLQKS